jgi:hypothetical protein
MATDTMPKIDCTLAELKEIFKKSVVGQTLVIIGRGGKEYKVLGMVVSDFTLKDKVGSIHYVHMTNATKPQLVALFSTKGENFKVVIGNKDIIERKGANFIKIGKYTGKL